jgi:uncharacterized protein YlaI
VPELACTLCGRVENVPKWHPSVAQHPDDDQAAKGYVCPACQDRVRADAVRQNDPGGPGAGR